MMGGVRSNYSSKRAYKVAKKEDARSVRIREPLKNKQCTFAGGGGIKRPLKRTKWEVKMEREGDFSNAKG